MTRTHRHLWAAFVACLLLLAGCTKQPSHSFQLSGATMGTRYHVTVVDPDRQFDPAVIQALVEQQLQESNQTFSTYIDDSELSLLNRAPLNQPIPVTPPLWDVLTLAMELSQLSGGAFDITVKPLVDIWGFGPLPSTGTLPTGNQITTALAEVGYQYIALDPQRKTVLKKRPLTLDLSGIAKGYAVDQLADMLQAQGIENAMVEIGGELRLVGHSPRGAPWRIAIETPHNALHQAHRIVNISDAAMATSGDYRNYFEHDGKRYSHTIDPRTGYPIAHTLASVTVIADSSARADALATAINVLGTDAGLQLANHYGLAVYLISQTKNDSENGFNIDYSDAFKPYLE